LDSRKRPTSDKRIDNEADKDESNEAEEEVEKVTNSIAAIHIAIKQQRKEKENQGIKERGWIGNITPVVRHCARCNDRIEKGLKCEACIPKLCLDWLSKIPSENSNVQVSKHLPELLFFYLL
jgi:hypothetical protein